ncbi:MAG: BON domain-containing protein [Acidobacteriota bacterium]
MESRIKSSDTLKGSDIDVAVDHGVVRLTGTVHSEAQSLRARSLAKVSGVTAVENTLTVDSKTARAMDKAGDKADRAADKGKDQTIDVDGNINDAWITTKVKSSYLNEDALKGSDINVDTNSHVVTLKGTVASAAGRTRAVTLARQVKGVNRVVDHLTIAAAR